ncbi:DNA-binding transcriptional regulator, ArsR family [Chryseolinea serpens]|uniref:DNA-binding transcriptional regulator, ArsR family n=1 Tax=Chryseolinea serpens TaxID=947013 RepID=A0A1M5JJB0_9BACT|nr:metalloregulator ArsR/SmtB family transcription factor [Chryseolinea serpens]SHG40360.1 DNA-binding transcriptional regulator, ArsR family [Chryseolinea serpens]
MNPKKAEKIAKALADPNRLLILQEIKKQDDCLYCVDIMDIIDLKQPSICHHIKQLTDNDLILAEKEGRNLKYRLNDVVLNEFIDFLEGLKKEEPGARSQEPGVKNLSSGARSQNLVVSSQ